MILSRDQILTVLKQHEGDTSPVDLTFTREDLADIFACLGFTRGAEIGVERGEYSEVLCKANPELELLGVDAWLAYPGYREHVSQAKLDGFYEETRTRLRGYRVTLMRDLSLEAAERVPDGSLDFVYLDANHSLPHVIADLAAWEPKVKAGGIVAGHDYRLSKGPAGAVFHVPYAVQAWTKAYQIAPWYVLRGDRSPSWFWVKRG